MAAILNLKMTDIIIQEVENPTYYSNQVENNVILFAWSQGFQRISAMFRYGGQKVEIIIEMELFIISHHEWDIL